VLGFGEIHDGDIVIARLLRKAAVLAAARHYLPLGVPVVKRVAAVPGDRVCAKDGMVRIDGDEAAFRKRRDSNGRPLPGWTGCVDLERHQYLLLSSDAWSFDGRYFGLTEASEIMGRGKLLWWP
jgi:type IV secretory pathway protease TraF